jgi:hypothetical protein
MTRQQSGSVIDSAKDGLVKAIRGSGEVGEAIVDPVSRTTVKALRDARSVGDEMGDTIVATVTGLLTVQEEPVK